MNTTKKAEPARCLYRAGSASFQILKQALADYAFEGGEVACFGDYAVSWNTRENLVAIANSGGWWTMPAADLKAIAAATPTAKESNEDALNRATHEIDSWVKSRQKPNNGDVEHRGQKSS